MPNFGNENSCEKVTKLLLYLVYKTVVHNEALYQRKVL